MLYPALPSGDPRLDQLQASVPRRFDQVNGEDRNVLAALQRVTTSRAARPGPLVAQEGVVAALHEYVARRLAAAPR